MSTIGGALTWANTLLEKVPETDPRLEAMILLGHVLQQNRSWLYAWPEKNIAADAEQQFRTLVERRATGTPIAYLTGLREFWSLDLEVTSDTLIPRPETELLVSLALELTEEDAQLRVLDLGTGSGAIAISIASERPGWSVTATDHSAAALAVARRNAGRHQLKNVSFLAGDWYQPLDPKQRFHIIISNPPYVATGDPHLEQGDLRFEPATALSSGVQGLDDLRKIIAQAPVFLNKDGLLLVEHGVEQGRLVSQLFWEAGFEKVETRPDLAHRDRVTLGRYSL